MKIWEKSYIAGIVDGEGCVEIQRHKKKGKKRQNHLLGRISIQICNEEVLKWIKKTSGFGNINETPLTITGKRRWCFRLSKQKDTLIFLKEILPFLKIKRKHAKLLINFLESRTSRHHNSPNIPKEFEMYRKMRKLNAWKGSVYRTVYKTER
jgi:hypothetical protein